MLEQSSITVFSNIVKTYAKRKQKMILTPSDIQYNENLKSISEDLVKLFYEEHKRFQKAKAEYLKNIGFMK